MTDLFTPIYTSIDWVNTEFVFFSSLTVLDVVVLFDLELCFSLLSFHLLCFGSFTLYVLLSSLQYFMMTFKTNVILASVKITTTTIIYSRVNLMSDAVRISA